MILHVNSPHIWWQRLSRLSKSNLCFRHHFVHIVRPLTLCYTVLSAFRVGVTMSGTSCGTRSLRLNYKPPRLDTA